MTKCYHLTNFTAVSSWFHAKFALRNCCWLKRYISREDEKYSSKPDTCLCVALLLQAWLSIPPKYSLQQYFIKKLPLPTLLHNRRFYPQSTSWLHQLVDTPRHKRICASLCSFKCGGWAARPAAGHKIAAGRKKEPYLLVWFFFSNRQLSILPGRFQPSTFDV